MKSLDELKSAVRNVPNFPIQGIQFKDVTPLFETKENLESLTQLMVDRYANKGITKIVGIESRGFIMAPIVAVKLGAGFVPIRKAGKLPYEIIEEVYEKEYGADVIQIHKGSITENDVVLLHDDLLATGGTMRAAYNLIKKMGAKKIYINFLIELEDLNGIGMFPTDVEIESLIKFDI